MDKLFLARVKRNEESGTYEKGLEIRNDIEDAKQGFHAYMAAYAYNHDATTDYVQCVVFDKNGLIKIGETWEKAKEEEVTPEPEYEPGE